MKIKKILVSQPKPVNDKSPYVELAERNNLKIDFRPFIKVEGISAKEFRQERIDLLEHTAVIFTSRTAIDHFFRIAEELRLTIPDDMKYFCISESVALYLQKYIVYRKRKIFYSSNIFKELVEQVISRHASEKFLVPLSDIHKPEIPRILDKNKIKYTKAILYRTVSSDLSDLSDVNYDILVFYSPSGIKSLYDNFPDFEQRDTKIACFGPHTAKAIKKAGLKLDIEAPSVNAPSMTMALEKFIREYNKNGVAK
ncbi:MAG: uroporphyrinogen-III synthase [Bacteroidales bacterium]